MGERAALTEPLLLLGTCTVPVSAAFHDEVISRFIYRYFGPLADSDVSGLRDFTYGESPNLNVASAVASFM
jgi:hypothetical protein